MNVQVKKWLCIGTGFGAGAVLMAALLIGGLIFYQTAPKSWNTQAVTATFSEPIYSFADKTFNIASVTLEYVVSNNTDEDYTISTNHTFLVMEKDEVAHSPFSESYQIEKDCFLPAHTKIKCSLSAHPSFTADPKGNGFAIFDTSSRYKILFPEPTAPSEKERTEAEEGFRKDFAEFDKSQ